MAKVTFKGISIENLGPFREREYMDLSVKASRPIILIKALNGSGKTTLLTCLQIALYGNKALGSGRNSEYEQLIRGLQRSDATGQSKICLDLVIEYGRSTEELQLVRQWSPGSQRLNEGLEILRSGEPDNQLALEWVEYIDSILPAELLQLFLFDGEKIESLANPRSLPEMLKRATEAFFGIGGVDALSKDLIAVERRMLLEAKSVSADYDQAKGEMDALLKEEQKVHDDIGRIQHHVDQALRELEAVQKSQISFEAEARRDGVDAFEQAGEIRAREALARGEVASAEAQLCETLADPYLPLATLGSLWVSYKDKWEGEQASQSAKVIAEEVKQHDTRVLQGIQKVTRDASLIEALTALLEQEQSRYAKAAAAPMMLIDAPSPSAVEDRVGLARKNFSKAQQERGDAKERLAKLERQAAAIPSQERIADVLAQLKAQSALVVKAEANLALQREQLSDREGRAAHLKQKLELARERMGRDFQGQEWDAKAMQASQRTRAVLAAFKAKLLASKAEWLSQAITEEFRGFLRKQRLIDRVLVEPETYTVGILTKDGSLLPMERLSAGERQLLAIAVLSALIRERKGRFPVVVDTPLARLDRTHRKTLINRFFSKVSHQVLVLSTDEEVEGVVMEEMARFTSRSYQIQFMDDERRSTMGDLYKEAA
jgi:DNA sulfur modification protein DndD